MTVSLAHAKDQARGADDRQRGAARIAREDVRLREALTIRERNGAALLADCQRAVRQTPGARFLSEHEYSAVVGAVLADVLAGAREPMPSGNGRPADVLAWIARAERDPAAAVGATLPTVTPARLALIARGYIRQGNGRRSHDWQDAYLTARDSDPAPLAYQDPAAPPVDVMGRDVLTLAYAVAQRIDGANPDDVAAAVASAIAGDRRKRKGVSGQDRAAAILARMAPGVGAATIRKRAQRGRVALASVGSREDLRTLTRGAAAAAGLTAPRVAPSAPDTGGRMGRPTGSAADVLAWIDRGAALLGAADAIAQLDPGARTIRQARFLGRIRASLRTLPTPGPQPMPAAAQGRDGGQVGRAVDALTAAGGMWQRTGKDHGASLEWDDRTPDPGAVTLTPPTPTPGNGRAVVAYLRRVDRMLAAGVTLADPAR